MTTTQLPPALQNPAPAAPKPNAALLELVEPVRGRLLTATAMTATAAAARVLALVFAGELLRVLLTGGDAAAWPWLLAVVAAMVASAVLGSLAGSVSHHAAFDHEVLVRRRITEHLGRLPLGVVARIGAGGTKKIVVDDVRGLHAAVADTPPLLGTAVGGTVAALVALGVVEWRLLLVVIAVLPVVAIVMRIVMADHEVQRRGYDEAAEAIDAAVVEYAQGMQEVRTFDGGSDSFTRFAARVHTFSDRLRDWTEQSRTGALCVRLLIAPLPVTVLVAAAGAGMATLGWVDPVDVVIALLLAAVPIDAVMPLMWLSEFLNRSRAAAARISEVLAMAPLVEPAAPQRPRDGSVTLRGVRFGYDTERAPALDGVDLHVPDGTVCALVGPSGSGKSTLARLVPRFFDVDSGTIEVGGVDVREIATRDLLRHVAIVFQDPFLLRASVRDNLTLAAPDATDEQVHAAARAARVHDDVMALPRGYDTVVGERGATLSGGQRQRLTIARALLCDAAVVVLDEATAFTDPENEADIQDAIAELTRGRTVLVVAHRLATIVDAHQIAVLDGGRIVERGPHSRLLAAGDRYAALWERHLAAQGWGLRHRQETGS